MICILVRLKSFPKKTNWLKTFLMTSFTIYTTEVYILSRIYLYADFELVKKLSSYFVDFEQSKTPFAEIS